MANRPNKPKPDEAHALAERAWRRGNGDFMSAVKELRNWTGLSLVKAIKIIEAAKPGFARPGQRLSLRDKDGRVIRRIEM
jgi:hypothetical protein